MSPSPVLPKDPPPDPPPSGGATVDITGDATATGQPVIIEKDSKNHLVVGADQPGFADVLSFWVAAGSPTITDLGGCGTDPADLVSTDPTAVQRLIDRLEDPVQARGFRFKVNRRDPDNLTGAVIHTWFDDGDDGDGHQYRTWVIESFLRGGPEPTVTKHLTETEEIYTYTGGSIVSWDLDTNEVLACPNGGTVTVTLNR